MKPNQFIFLAALPLLLIDLIALFTGVIWLAEISEIAFLIIVFLAFLPEINIKNPNPLAFSLLISVALILQFFREEMQTPVFMLFLSMIAYFFLYREAVSFTKIQGRNIFMYVFFFAIVLLNMYFMYIHVQEISRNVADSGTTGIYFFYYFNLLIFAVIGLIYYLNSYSKKSVYFIATVMAFVFSDVFRDMIQFYLAESSILVLKQLLKFLGLILAYKFLTTPERKLSLTNLI